MASINSEFKVNEVFPRMLIVPAGYADSTLKKLMKDTALSCSWRSPRSKAVLVRVTRTKSGKQVEGDSIVLSEEVMTAVRQSLETEKLVVLHVREAKEKAKNDTVGIAMAAEGSGMLTTTKGTKRALKVLLEIATAGKKSNNLSIASRYTEHLNSLSLSLSHLLIMRFSPIIFIVMA